MSFPSPVTLRAALINLALSQAPKIDSLYINRPCCPSVLSHNVGWAMQPVNSSN